MKLNVIVAYDKRNGGIGKDNELVWKLSQDLKNFKSITKDGIVVMGRKTWESLPENYRPLPERSNVVIQVINLRGEIIFYKNLDNLEPGYYNQIWNAGSHSAGIYFCKILIGDKIQETIKMVLIK